jgi:hypothetical protein
VVEILVVELDDRRGLQRARDTRHRRHEGEEAGGTEEGIHRAIIPNGGLEWDLPFAIELGTLIGTRNAGFVPLPRSNSQEKYLPDPWFAVFLSIRRDICHSLAQIPAATAFHASGMALDSLRAKKRARAEARALRCL